MNKKQMDRLEVEEEETVGEYPRPQMRRNSYLNLNGYWKYAIRKEAKRPSFYDGKIRVPFSPETKLSEVEKVLQPDETLWYERELHIPEGFYMGGRILLHFGAVDQICEVYINDECVTKHTGGYTSFSVDITDYLLESNKIAVCVRDYTDTSYQARGKQVLKPKGIWYAPTSGIWQTVWLENVPEIYISSLRITPLFDQKEVEITVFSKDSLPCRIVCNEMSVEAVVNEPVRISIPNVHNWSPEDPYLYTFSVTLGADRVGSYFGMRKFSVEEDIEGIKRLFLNNQPYYYNGILDQGYFPGGGYTPKTEDTYRRDLEMVKEMGFTMIRKHCKVEPMNWYYMCDKLGILVWQDIVNGGSKYGTLRITHPLFTKIHIKDSNYSYFSREDKKGREQFVVDMENTISQLINCTCISMWVLFNEGWGQFDANQLAEKIKQIDGTRTIDAASGWSDQKNGEIASHHVYFKKYRFSPDKLSRAVVLSEFGGISCALEDHVSLEKEVGYKKARSLEEYYNFYKAIFLEEIKPAIKKGLCASVYTQLSDVEGEINGLVTQDRLVEKIDRLLIKQINEELLEETIYTKNRQEIS